MISPPTTEKVSPDNTFKILPLTVIGAGVGPKNPKATGGATLKVLVSESRAKKRAPSAKRR
jgi:hypothetical protein